MKSLSSFRALRRTLCAAASVLFALPAVGAVTLALAVLPIRSVAETVTYTVADKTSVTVSGTAPAGSSAVYGQTGDNLSQATAGNSMTLTLSGYSGMTITGLTLSMKSNTSKGAGSLSAICGSSTIASIADSKFNTANWYGSWSTSYVDITPAVTETTVGANENIVITIAASANSLYCQSFTIQYTTGSSPSPTPTAPSISVTPSSATTVSVGDTVTATITTNNAVSVTATVGSFNGNSWSWTPTAAGSYTVTFTATGASGTTPATTTLTVSVTAAPSGPAVPTIAAASDLLSNGTGFTANWTPVSNVSGYQIQVATNALFDAVPNILVEEHFEQFTANSYANGWSGSRSSDLIYPSSLSGLAAPAFKFQATNQTLVSPTFSGGVSVSFHASPYNKTTGSSFVISESTAVAGGATGTISYPSITVDSGSGKTYTQTLSGNATQVTFKFTKTVNTGVDDIIITGTPINTVVNNPYSSASGASTSSLAITGLSPNTTYYVRVRSVSGSSPSDWSGYTTVKTEAGNTNYAPEITSFSPATATISLNDTQSFSLGFADDNHNDTLTLAVTDNGTPLSSATLAGVSGTTNYSYTATTPGTHTLLFTLSDHAGASTNASASVTVPVPVPTISPIDTATMLENGTGFSVAWSAVSVATGYELQIATNALFDVGRDIVAEEHFDTLTNGIPQGWGSSKTSGYYYNAAANHYGISQPSYKFDTNNQTLTTPVVSSPVWAVGFNTYGQSGGVSTLTVVGLQNGSSASQVAIQPAETTMVEQLVELTAAADQVRFSFTKVKNLSLDDVVLYGPAADTIVQTTNVAASVTTVDLVNLDPNTTYYVRIRALYNGEASDWSAAVSATTPTGGANFPPQLSVTPATASVTGGQTVPFSVEYSDPNANDALALAVSIDGTAATSLNIASGGTYTYTPAVAGAHRLIFSVTDGLSTTYSTNDVTVALATPVMGAISNPTSNPYGFTANWTGVALNDGYEVEVATDPLFDAAPGAIVFSEDFTTLTETDPPTAWSASADSGLRYTSSTRCGELAPAFRFGTSGDTLESPTFPVGGTHLTFFAYSTKGPQKLYAIGKTANGEETKEIAIAEGKGTYETIFSSAVTGLKFEFSQDTAGGYVGLDDIVVRTAKTVDSRVSRVRTAADATSNPFTGLAGAVSYYVRVRAVSDHAESDWSDTAEVPFLAATENIQFHHGKYIEDGTSLSWNAAIGAASYNVKVLEANIVTNVPLVEEFFDLGTTTVPAGWTFTGTIETSGDGYCGDSAPALKLKNGASVTTPTLEYPAKSVSLIASATGSSGGSLSLSALVDGNWQVVSGTISPENKKPTLFSFQLPEGTTKVKVAFDNYVSGTNFAIDDFIVWGIGPVWHNYANTYTNLTTTTLPLPGLRHDTPYIFTISSVNAFGEVAAEPFKVTSPPTNPGTIIRFF